MLLVFQPREQFIKLLPRQAVMAEIGTQHGGFAERILQAADPAKLHLIDPWEHQENPDYAADGCNYSNDEFSEVFKNVQARFAPQTATGQVAIHRAYSPQAADLFPDDYFDIIYVDGMHTKDAVLADLRAFDRKVKKDGLIMGHDYTVHPTYRAMNFGVVEAVNQFVTETGYEFLFLTSDPCATYVLAKSPQSKMRNILLNNVLINVPELVEIGSPEKRRMTERDVQGPDGKHFRTIFGFH